MFSYFVRPEIRDAANLQKWDGDRMCNSRQIKYFPIRLFRDIDEPVICRKKAVFIQNTNNGSKIVIYDTETGKSKSVAMKNTLCYNVHADNRDIVFEYSGSKRGVGIINIETLELTELDRMNGDIVLGGIWNSNIIFRKGHDIILLNIDRNEEKTLTSCHHILGSPVVGRGICAWLQVYRDKCCVMFHDIKRDRSVVLSSPGYINKLYAVDDYLVYQNCSNNKCSIYTYNIRNGQLKKIFESKEWIELYKGKDGAMVWTVRREDQTEYVFDIWIFNIYTEKMNMVLSECRSAVIPTASSEIILWVNSGIKGDNLYLMPFKS